jgi:hypothetical protein
VIVEAEHLGHETRPDPKWQLVDFAARFFGRCLSHRVPIERRQASSSRRETRVEHVV